MTPAGIIREVLADGGSVTDALTVLREEEGWHFIRITTSTTVEPIPIEGSSRGWDTACRQEDMTIEYDDLTLHNRHRIPRTHLQYATAPEMLIRCEREQLWRDLCAELGRKLGVIE